MGEKPPFAVGARPHYGGKTPNGCGLPDGLRRCGETPQAAMLQYVDTLHEGAAILFCGIGPEIGADLGEAFSSRLGWW